MTENGFTILIPTRPQPDTIVAIFLLKAYLREKNPAVEKARVEVRSQLGPADTFESLLAQNTIALDLGGFVLDHHGKNKCTSELVAEYLNIKNDPSIGRMLQYARRDDQEGKGTLSRDAIDRAFGLSGLISSLNKKYPNDPQAVVDAVLPLLDAQWHSAREHHIELPREVEEKKAKGEYHEYEIAHGDKKLKLICVTSDKPAMPTYLRSELGGRADVVLQKLEESNHFCVLTNQKRGVDLSQMAGLIRMREAQIANTLVPEDEDYMTQIGRIEEVPYWYYDPATNSLLNGGIHSRDTQESQIPHDEMKKLVQTGLEIGRPKKPTQ